LASGCWRSSDKIKRARIDEPRGIAANIAKLPDLLREQNEKLIMSNATAIVIGAVIIAAAILIVFRWQLVPGAMLLDRWTGTVVPCETKHSSDPPGKIYFRCD
jgi:hypothetical protein